MPNPAPCLPCTGWCPTAGIVLLFIRLHACLLAAGRVHWPCMRAVALKPTHWRTHAVAVAHGVHVLFAEFAWCAAACRVSGITEQDLSARRLAHPGPDTSSTFITLEFWNR